MKYRRRKDEGAPWTARDTAATATALTGAKMYGLGKLTSKGLDRLSGIQNAAFSPELFENLENYTRSYSDSGKLLDRLYTYAQSGHDLSGGKIFEGSDAKAGDMLDRMSAAVSEKRYAALNWLKRHGIGTATAKRLQRFTEKFIPRNNKWTSVHHNSFSLSPIEAYIQMAEEGLKPMPNAPSSFNVGKLADDILEANYNWKNPKFTKGHVFKSPAEYFSWKHGDEFGLGWSTRPIRSEFAPGAKGTKDYLLSLRDYVHTKTTDVPFEGLFNKLKFADKNRVLSFLGEGTGMTNEQVASSNLIDLFRKLVGKGNEYALNPDGSARLVAASPRKFETLASLMENRSNASELFDPILARKFRNSSRPYTNFRGVAKALDVLSSKGFRRAGAAGAIVGGGALAASRIAEIRKARAAAAARNNRTNFANYLPDWLRNFTMRKSGSVKSAASDDRSSGLKDLLIALAGGGSAIGSGMYGSKYRLRDFNPFADTRVAVFGGIKDYDPVARDAIPKSLETASKVQDIARSGDSGKISNAIAEFERVAAISESAIEKDQAIKSIDYLKEALKGNIEQPVESLLPDRVVKAFRQDSFSSQTQSTMDELRRRGIKVDKHILGADTKYNRTEMSPKLFRNADAIVQVGSHPTESIIAQQRARRGTPTYRVLSDFGPGNFNQPDRWAGYNWMKVNDPSMYDRFIVPGGEYFEQAGKMGPAMRGAKPNLSIDNIAVSPLFKNQAFASNLGDTAGRRAKAMFTFGGGSAAMLGVYDPKLYDSNMESITKRPMTASALGTMAGLRADSVRRSAILDEIEAALRQKYGANFDLDLYIGDALSSMKSRGTDSSGLMEFLTSVKNRGNTSRQIRDTYQSLPENIKKRLEILSEMRSKYDSDFNRESSIRDKFEKRYQELLKANPEEAYKWTTNSGPTEKKMFRDASIPSVAERLKLMDRIAREERLLTKKLSELGLNGFSAEEIVRRGALSAEDLANLPYVNTRLVERVPQSQIAKAYANSDVTFMLPGSTSAEYLSMGDNPAGKRGRLIAVVPQEFNGWTPSHFGTNAEYAQHVLPDARIVRADSATRAKDFIEAVAGETKPGKLPLRTKEPWDLVAKTMKSDVLKKRLMRSGKLGLIAAPALLATGYGINRAAGSRKKEAPSMPTVSSGVPASALLGLAGLAGAGGLLYHMNRRRKRKDREMRKMSSDASRKARLKIAIKTASCRMTKKAAPVPPVKGPLAAGFSNLFKGLGSVGKGTGQIGYGIARGVGRTAYKGTKGVGRYFSLLLGSKGSKLDRAYDALINNRAAPEEIFAAQKAKNKEWRKVIATRIATLAGLGGGTAALVAGGDFED